MADRDDENADETQQEQLKGDKAKEAKQLDAVTDFVEEKEVGDSEKAKAALLSFSAEDSAASSAAESRARQLASIKVKSEDVALLVKELELTEDDAEQRLKEKNNDIQQVIREFIQQ
jgi:type IV pilus biogenesis protein CpaD/CtpE